MSRPSATAMPLRWAREIPIGLYPEVMLIGVTGAVPALGAAVAVGGLRFAPSWSDHLVAPTPVRPLGRPAPANPLDELTERERSVLALMAEGLSNAAIAGRLFLSEGAISKYTTTIFAKLGILADDDTNRRVRAVLAYLGVGE